MIELHGPRNQTMPPGLDLLQHKLSAAVRAHLAHHSHESTVNADHGPNVVEELLRTSLVVLDGLHEGLDTLTHFQLVLVQLRNLPDGSVRYRNPRQIKRMLQTVI